MPCGGPPPPHAFRSANPGLPPREAWEKSLLGNGRRRRVGRRQDEDLAIAHPPGPGRRGDPLDNLGHPGVFDPELNLDLGEEGQRILAFAILVEVALLPPVALDLADRAGFQRCQPQPLEHPLGEVGLHDRDHFLHAHESNAARRAPKAETGPLARLRGPRASREASQN